VPDSAISGLSGTDEIYYGTPENYVNVTNGNGNGTYQVTTISGSAGFFCIGDTSETQQISIQLLNYNHIREADGTIDISDNPITIQLYTESGSIDPASAECWQVKDHNRNDIYRKHRTLENSMTEYGMLEIKTKEQCAEPETYYMIEWVDKRYIFSDTSKYCNTLGIVPPDEFWDILKDRTILKTIAYAGEQADSFYTELIRFLDNNYIPSPSMLFYQNPTKIDSVTLKTNSLYCELAFSGANIRHIKLVGPNITSTHWLFKDSWVETVEAPYPFGCNDMSATFEFCFNLKTIPAGMFKFAH